MIPLRLALEETLRGWREDINPAWRGLADDVRLDFDGVAGDLMIEPWEPMFPTRRNRSMPGEPPGAHIFRAFDGIVPEDVRCVLLGQDPYPCPAFSTGRAFEAGNTAHWRELDKMFSRSVRAFLLQIVAARTNRPEFASSFDQWPAVLSGIESGSIPFEEPRKLARRWVESGVLLLNSSLTLSRFKVEVDRHQSEGHLPLWRPFIRAVLNRVAALNRHLVVIAMGDAASGNAVGSGIGEIKETLLLHRPHPAAADEFLECPNPFLACNDHLNSSGGRPIDW